MKVTGPLQQRTRAQLPRDVTRPFEVFVNGVPQREGDDYAVDGTSLVFERDLRTEGRLGPWRWAAIMIGVVGTYRQNDSVDIAYTRRGQKVVATKLPLEPV
jgi:hypothetical protein